MPDCGVQQCRAAATMSVSISHSGCILHSAQLTGVVTVPVLLQVGMRYFNKRTNKYHSPIVNLDKLWTLVGDEVRITTFTPIALHSSSGEVSKAECSMGGCSC